MAKVEVVGSKALCKSLKETSKHFYSTVIEYLPKRKPIDDYTAKLNLLNSQIENCHNKSQNILAQMKENRTPEQMTNLNDQFDLNMTKWDEVRLNYDQVFKERLNFALNLQQELTINLMELNKIVSKCKKNIRIELRLPDEEIFNETEIVAFDNDMFEKVSGLQKEVKTWI